MSTYAETITTELIRVLDHARELNAHRVAGYAANIDFWVGEAVHCLAVLDTYQERFLRRRAATHAYEYPSTSVDGPPPDQAGGASRMVTRAFKTADRERLRRDLLTAMERLLACCSRLDLVTEEDLQDGCKKLGVDRSAIGAV